MMPDKCPYCLSNTKKTIGACRVYFCGTVFVAGHTFPFDNYICGIGERDVLWQLRLALTEIAWAARCEYERTKKFNEGYDAGFSQARLRALIGTGGDTK